MTNEMPKEAGFYLFAWKQRAWKRDHNYGEVRIDWERHEEGPGRLCCYYHDEYGLQSFWVEDFDQYDWHRIELPEGWR